MCVCVCVSTAQGCWQSPSTSSALHPQQPLILPFLSFPSQCIAPLLLLWALAGWPRHCAQMLARRGGAWAKSACQLSPTSHP